MLSSEQTPHKKVIRNQYCQICPRMPWKRMYVLETTSNATTPLDNTAEELEEVQRNKARDLELLISNAYKNDQRMNDIMEAKQRGDRRLPMHVIASGIKLSMGDIEVRGDKVWLGEQLFIPEDHELRRMIFEMHHMVETAGHPGPKRI